MKQTHDLVQGTDAWDQFRLEHFGASEAAAMLGLSKKTTRNELLRMKKTGIAKTFSEWLQVNVLDYGHEVEALARPHIEKLIGEELYAVTCSDGKESASCDGLTMDDRIAMEHKQWNEALAAVVAAGQVPEEHMPQCQQVLKVTGAEKLIFVVSDGTPEKMVFVWVMPDPVWFERLRAGWAQFEQDLAHYVPTEVVAEPVGRAPGSLPALHVVLKGEVSASNLAEFKEVALSAIRSVNRDLKTDQDFADSAKARKWCEDIEARVAAAKEHALGQTASIDQLFRTMDEISTEARDVRLELKKLEDARKESRKGEIVAGGIKGLADHIAALNERLGKPYMPSIPVDFGGVIKGMRSFDSMQNAVDTALANAKITASAAADRIQINLGTLRELATELAFLFPDTQVIVQKAPDDLTALVKNRIADHQAKEQARLGAERERIRNEELARIERNQEAERQRLASEAAAQAATAATPPASTPSTAPAAVTPLPTAPSSASVAAPAPTVIPMPTRAAAAPASAPTLRLGVINERLSPIAVTADGLASLGFTPAAKDRSALMFHEADFPHICAALANHLQRIQAKQAA